MMTRRNTRTPVHLHPAEIQELPSIEIRAILRGADVVVLHQIKLSAIEARLFAAFSRRRVFDVDDAGQTSQRFQGEEGSRTGA